MLQKLTILLTLLLYVCVSSEEDLAGANERALAGANERALSDSLSENDIIRERMNEEMRDVNGMMNEEMRDVNEMMSRGAEEEVVLAERSKGT